MKSWQVYIILCSDNSLYTGITNNVEKRFEQHSNGSGAKYFRGRKPEKLVYLESGHTRSTATIRESEIKKLRRSDKCLLISSDINEKSKVKKKRRTVLSGYPHHIIQRGDNGRQIFFGKEDYLTYIEFMADSCLSYDIEIWTYCLMPDHSHLIAVPKEKDSLSAALRKAHSRYTKYINKRKGLSGRFWKGRFASHVMDEHYLIACARYIEINPVKRDYVKSAEQWKWSSAVAHINGKDDGLVKVKPLLSRVKKNWSDFLSEYTPSEESEKFYEHEKSGKPLGNFQGIDLE